MIPLKILRTAFVLAPALAALVAAPALAQGSSPQGAASTATGTEAPQAVDEVVVRGRRLSEIESDLRIYIDKFLDEVAAPARGRGYARWHRGLCVGVHNLENTAAQYVVDRISQQAVDLGLEPGAPGGRAEASSGSASHAAE